MTRQEKENYLVTMCDKYGFRKGVSNFSDYVLELKLDSLNDLIDEMKDNE